MKKLNKYIIIIQFVIIIVLILVINPLSCMLYTFYFADKYDLDKTLYYRQINAESSFRCFVKSEMNAIGLGQVMLNTAVYMHPKVKQWHLYIPWVNLDISAKYMRYLLNRYENNFSLALAAYNWGESNVDRLLKGERYDTETDYRYLFIEIKETYSFLETILGR